MSDIPKEIRKQLKSFISQSTDEALDLVVNLTGKYIDKKQRIKVKRDFESGEGARIEETITKAYRLGLQLKEESEQKKLETGSLKEKFYFVTDAIFKSAMPEIPKNVHAMDYLFQICEELLRDFRFNWRYLKNTKYAEYQQGLEKLMGKLTKEHKIGESWEVLNEFKNSEDFYLLLQATLQRVIKHYEFLRRNFPKIAKKQVDKYLEVYEELSGHYEKFVSLIAALIRLLRMNADYRYEAARKKGANRNIRFIENSGWKIFVSGYNGNIRNAIAHKTCKVDIIKETVKFIDRNKAFTLTFNEVQKETRELSALLLILPHVLMSIFCLAILSIRDMLENLPEA